MVAGSIIAAFAAILVPMGAQSVKLHHKDAFEARNELMAREVTVTVTYCPESAAPPVYTTAPLPPADSTTTVPATLTTTSMVTPVIVTDTGEGPSPPPTSILTPVIPIPVTPTTYDTTEITHSVGSIPATTAITGTGTGSATTTHTTSATTHSFIQSTASGGPSSAPPSPGGAEVAHANLALMILVAVAALI